MTHPVPSEVMLFCFAALAASYRLRVGLKTITVIDHHGKKVGAWDAQTERWSIDHDRGRGSESTLRANGFVLELARGQRVWRRSGEARDTTHAFRLAAERVTGIAIPGVEFAVS